MNSSLNSRPTWNTSILSQRKGKKVFKYKEKLSQAQWHTLVIIALRKAEARGSQFVCCLGNLSKTLSQNKTIARFDGICLYSQHSERLKQEDHKFKPSLSNLTRPSLKKNQKYVFNGEAYCSVQRLWVKPQVLQK